MLNSTKLSDMIFVFDEFQWRLAESNVNFSLVDVELMSVEIGDIPGGLKSKSVFDLEKERPIIVLDRSMAHVQFRKIELLEVHRFMALVKKNLTSLEYLVRNPSFFTVTDLVEKDDRIMGAINYEKTMQLRRMDVTGKKKAVCVEILRNYASPEDILVTQVLFSIALYCDKYIIFESLIEARDRQNPTLDSLRAILAISLLFYQANLLRTFCQSRSILCKCPMIF
jgi:hypothetical protein